MHQPKSITEQLADHIKRNLAKGYNQDTLRFSLMSQGYSRITVDTAIERAHKELASTIPLVKEKPQITYKIINQDNQPIKTIEVSSEKKPWWKRIFD